MRPFWKLVLLSSLACLALAFLPSFAFALAIVWGVFLVMAGHYLDWRKLVTLFGLNLLLLFVLLGSADLLLLLGIYGLPALLMGLLLTRGRGYYQILKWGMLSAVLGMSLVLAIVYFQSGSQIEKIKSNVEKNVQESIKWSEDSGLIDLYQQYGISREEIESSFQTLARTISLHLPALYYLQAILGVFIIIFLSSYFSKKISLSGLEKKPFREEIMPWQLSWVVILGLALWLWGLDQKKVWYYVGSNILTVLVPVMLYFGGSNIAYRLTYWKGRNRGTIISLLVVSVVLFPIPSLIFISLLGLFDSLLDYRRLQAKKEGEQ